MSGGPGSLAAVRLFLCFDFFYFSAGACIVLEFVSILHSRALGFGSRDSYLHLRLSSCETTLSKALFMSPCLCQRPYLYPLRD
jgi:hypothetical protein